MTTTTYTKVIAGSAGHWYALTNDDGKDVLVGLPMSGEGSGFPHDINDPPEHPHISDPGWLQWYEITDPAPETDIDALVAELKR